MYKLSLHRGELQGTESVEICTKVWENGYNASMLEVKRGKLEMQRPKWWSSIIKLVVLNLCIMVPYWHLRVRSTTSCQVRSLEISKLTSFYESLVQYLALHFYIGWECFRSIEFNKLPSSLVCHDLEIPAECRCDGLWSSA